MAELRFGAYQYQNLPLKVLQWRWAAATQSARDLDVCTTESFVGQREYRAHKPALLRRGADK
jgi:hypothetical protein